MSRRVYGGVYAPSQSGFNSIYLPGYTYRPHHGSWASPSAAVWDRICPRRLFALAFRPGTGATSASLPFPRADPVVRPSVQRGRSPRCAPRRLSWCMAYAPAGGVAGFSTGESACPTKSIPAHSVWSVVPEPPVRLERGNPLRRGQLHFHLAILPILGLILGIVPEHILIPQFHRDSRRHAGQVAGESRRERAATGLRRNLR